MSIGLTDQVFQAEITNVSDFKFNDKVASVFDDMVNRSVPFYEEIQRMIGEIAADFTQGGDTVYDLGCSTGTTLLYLDQQLDPSVRFIGIDDSAEMLHKCKDKLDLAGLSRQIELKQADLHETIVVQDAQIVVMCLTLQFVRPLFREKLLREILNGLRPGGLLILVEKVLAEDSSFNRSFIDFYYNMKRRNLYSELEISQKREALENVLIPYKLSENILMLKQAGFKHCETFFKWYNFAGIIVEK